MDPYQLAYKYVLDTNQCLFLTGKAGTGKTTLLRRLQQECPKQMAVVAPTGVAAINAEGVTIHSLFQLPPQLFLPTPAERRKLFSEMQMRRDKQRLLYNLELLVIDEISMVRSDLLDTIDAVLRRYKHRPNLPFGGAQVLFIGDLFQLSPVVREEEWNYLREFYQGPYFFQARVFQEIRPMYIELDHVYRQDDSRFIDLLNEVRDNRLSPASFALLNSRYQPNWEPSEGEPFHIILSTHNKKVDAINERELAKLNAKTHQYAASVEGKFPESLFPMEETLTLSEGARVMFVRNDSTAEKRYYNGKLGVVSHIDGEHITVECETLDGQKEQIEVHREMWENIRYVTAKNSDEITTVVDGTFTQIPLRLAWAVTIHKAQGLTFDRVVIDSKDAFAAGQVYVALSRCRTLEGIILLSPIPASALTNAREVLAFTAAQPTLEQAAMGLQLSERAYFVQILCSIFDFRDSYRKTENLLRLVDKSTSFNQDTAKDYLEALLTVLSEWQHTAEIFQLQIRQILFAETLDIAFLTQRLQAASAYFSPRISDLLERLQSSPVYADDQQDAKEYEENINELFVDMSRQMFVMEHTAKQPSVSHYFEARSQFKAPNPHISAQGEKAAQSSETKNPVLLKRLYALRRTIAEERGCESQPYLVAQTKSLIEISNTLPTTEKALLAVNGIGKKKCELIGERILQAVRLYVREQNSAAPNNASPTAEAIRQAQANRQFASATVRTLTAFLGGNRTISGLAKALKLTPKKIGAHLSELLQNGIIHYSDLTPEDRESIEKLLNKG